MRKKRLNAGTLIAALLISGLLFSAGLFVGYTAGKEKLSQVESELVDISSDVENFQLQMLFIDTLGEKATCPLLSAQLSEINQKADSVGTRLEQYLQGSLTGEDVDFNKLSESYARVLTSYWLLATKFQQACETNVTTVVFFVSKACNELSPNPCDDQGFVLSYFKGVFKDDLLVFTLRADLSEPSIHVLRDYYNVTEYPTIVVNGEKHEGFVPKAELEAILCNKGLCT